MVEAFGPEVTQRFFAMPNSEDVVSIARLKRTPGALCCERWARSEPGWKSVPSLFTLIYDGEGGAEISEGEALGMIHKWSEA
jgi:hypothetical protein